MAEEEHVHVSGGYFPVYPQRDNLPDQEIRTFITNFYRVSDQVGRDELWVSYFSKGAKLTMGRARATGHEEIRTVRKGMWNNVSARRHSVKKVFPAKFKEGAVTEENPLEHELMLFGEVTKASEDDKEQGEKWQPPIPWAAHMVLRKEKDGERAEWRIGEYKVWLQS